MIRKIQLGSVLVVVVMLGTLFSGCVDLPPATQGFKEMKRFNSYAELKAAFEEAKTSRYGYGGGVLDVLISPMVGDSAMQITSARAENALGEIGGSDDFSTTNIQVEGVDEADIVKSDGKYIYNVINNTLIITDAYPIDSAEILVQYDLNDVSAYEIFIEDDKLLLFGNKVGYSGGGYRYESYGYGRGGTAIQLYDISDKRNPKLENELEFEGSYVTSRLIGKNAYFVINSYPKYYPRYVDGQPEEENIIPTYTVDGVVERIAAPTDIAYIPPMPTETFVTIASINVDNGNLKKETIAGSAQNVFASMDNIYLASTTWLPTDDIVPFEDANTLEDIVKRIVPTTEQRTVINKFGLVDGEIGFRGQGIVPGNVLNQFSMDEYKGNFRIATTKGQVWSTNSQSTNNLYVLDKDMKTIGTLEDLAPGERIYSARFMGDRAYMVTFKKVDPLFVIDVSNPNNPKVLGKLKIPGYSDYLHPIDEGHIIGVGKETIESTYGDFAWYQGIKMAVFDVTDVKNPIEMHKIVIGDRGTDSYALRDHKAFLFDKEKDLLVLPIQLAVIPEAEKNKSPEEQRWSPSFGETVFQGAFVYRLTLEDGFEERGRITHITEEQELKRGFYWGYEYSVKRALYIGNVLYTLSDQQLQANALDTLEELKIFLFNTE